MSQRSNSSWRTEHPTNPSNLFTEEADASPGHPTNPFNLFTEEAELPLGTHSLPEPSSQLLHLNYHPVAQGVPRDASQLSCTCLATRRQLCQPCTFPSDTWGDTKHPSAKKGNSGKGDENPLQLLNGAAVQIHQLLLCATDTIIID